MSRRKALICPALSSAAVITSPHSCWALSIALALPAAVAHYRRYCDNQSAIAFTITVEHAGHVVEQFKSAGYQAAVLTGSTPDKERVRMIKDLGIG